MIATNLKVAARAIARGKGTSVINLAGLAVGMAACLLILLFVRDELSYDRYHADPGRVVRVTEVELDEAGTPSLHRALLDPPLAPLAKSAIPEITHAARLTPVGPDLSVGDRYVDSGHCYWADPDVFAILSFRMLAGDAATALDQPFSLVLSATKAAALFGDEDPLGKSVLVNNRDAFTVTGVFADLPHSTHLPVDVLGSIATMESWFGELSWGSPNYATYFRLADGASAAAVETKLAALIETHRGSETSARSTLELQQLTDIHLRSHLVGELAPNGDIRYVYLFSAIAGFILLIACVNFMNLATARSNRRAKEVGMRKALGARRGELVAQFLGESVLVAFVSVALAIGIVALALPYFGALAGKDLKLFDAGAGFLVASLVAVGLLVGLAAGSYPALYLSAFRPVVVLKGLLPGDKRGSGFRKALVVGQFAIAIVLLISTVAVYRQLAYIGKQNLGFDQEQLLVLPTVWDLRTDFDGFREQLVAHPDVMDVTQSNPVPSGRLFFSVESSGRMPGADRTTEATLFPVFVDQHFFPTYAIPFAAGRNFSDEFASDTDTGFILNRTAASALGWSNAADAIGAEMTVGGWRGYVIGVTEDFHLESLHQKIAPMVFYMDPRNFRLVTVRARAGADIASLGGFLQDKWQQEEPGSPVSWSFLDERLGAVYDAERRLGRIVGAFAALAVFVTCLGLFGMAAFAVERRTKEIGIRKVLGASAAGIVLLLSREFTRLVLVAFVVAALVAPPLLRPWLESFAYRAGLSWWVFAAAGLAAVAIAWLTVSVQAARAARANPVETLRYE